MQRINIKNKRASFEFELIEKFVAGIQLFGTEIKSIREGKASLVDSFCYFSGNELYVKEMHISEYKFGSYYNHEEKRERKLLLNRKELDKLDRKTKESGLTIVPLRLFINDRGFAKMEIALCRGKKHYDKRESLKQRDHKREIDRLMKR
ncbi:SsrA-binding protein [Ancylomarina longa]|uniref:SsrA-binding protein n=1 Tax=Ancylomarina longa TaxID=2487017 RepID=A0A434AVK0_9BACT|nr:SsrA-binding protein [Ancylomarina longa]RUT78517.1 SsrA-binding protein [Ancylomarina longa]